MPYKKITLWRFVRSLKKRELGRNGWSRFTATRLCNIHLWADRRYLYSLGGSVFHRILGYVARFMEMEKVFPKEVLTDDILDVSVITEALKTLNRDQ